MALKKNEAEREIGAGVSMSRVIRESVSAEMPLEPRPTVEGVREHAD